MSMSLDAAASVMREAMRETVKRHSLWYLIQGALMVIAGVLALIYPLVSTVAVVLFLGWLLIISGILQGISLFDARRVPHFWLQLVSVALFIIVGVLVASLAAVATSAPSGLQRISSIVPSSSNTAACAPCGAQIRSAPSLAVAVRSSTAGARPPTARVMAAKNSGVASGNGLPTSVPIGGTWGKRQVVPASVWIFDSPVRHQDTGRNQ
mgnify:CR=1 FL=1